ncbi:MULTISPECIES: glycosyltransferase [unclassified Mucilaginibacter]|uniref:glycosyltransferase n=1 Tax=unclassified Mucilaginibacter TaxID=2617802 RepID=UPI002AC908B7|nr:MULTISPECIES: glycosyltransferase [unclassified Mucilaginibacter]MEB0260641.1 glycosyltransferase [Mucilaginibacter sp. 10I4]MEB0277474.1 glycosyltransferase [Mucilaginibacter sp. 10B2]MEB0302327.1 glycosyltransferase [Mucilaginibacter sp. 5C4]WPX24896.1 glycosyltransferase [Mucilaginibacter sp. 5C4]
MSITLSYIISTKNRLPFLKVLLGNLLPVLNADEEIVVVDGNSIDGTQDYLQGLFNANKIHQYISEPDKNQAHGWNKALLMAKGTIIKKLIDDDVHHINAIRKCRDFMMANADVDLCISNHLQSHLTHPDQISITGRLENYRDWKAGKVRSFTFSDISLLQRKASLSYLGLYDTQFKMMDWEYALRVTYLKAKIAYYTGYNSLSVATPGNVTSGASLHLLKNEGKIGKAKYEYAGDQAGISRFSRIKVWLGNTWHRLKTRQAPVQISALPGDADLQKIYASYYQTLDEYNNAGTFHFIT